jgi:hypothetical protein
MRVQWKAGRAYRIGLEVLEEEIKLCPSWGLNHESFCVQYAAPSLCKLSLEPVNFQKSGTTKSAINKEI